ncbi:MFS general substrate transporter [Hypoxylon fuscum]|nr:MFS general substrate transporter [Hypoxylon fuscum]
MSVSKSVNSDSVDVKSLAADSSPETPPTLRSHDESGHDSTKDISREKTHSGESFGDASREESSDPSVDPYPHGLRLVLIAGAVMFSVFLMSVDQTIVGTAIPKITNEFHGLDKVAWYGSAYFSAFGAFQSSWGKAYRYFPLKTTFLVSMAIFEIGSLICGVAPNDIALIVGRAIAGLGGAGIMAGGYTILAFSAEPARRPFLMGFSGATYGIAAVVGPVLGGVFSDRLTWRWCFYINLPIGGVAAFVILLFFHAPANAGATTNVSLVEKLAQMDPVGIILTMSAIICFILALQYGGVSQPWNGSVVVGLLVGSVAIAVALCLWEIYQGERAMIVPRLFKQRFLWVSCIYQFCLAGAYYLVLYYIPIYFQSIDDTSAIMSGVRNLPMVVAVCICSLAGGIAVSKTGHATPFLIAGAAVATIGTGLLYSLDIGTPMGKWIGYQILIGAGYSFPFMITTNIAQDNAAPEDVSTVTAIVFFFNVLGGSLSLSAAQSAFVNSITVYLVANAPDLNPQDVVATGVAEIRHVFSDDQIQSILLAYMSGIRAAFAIGIALVGLSCLAGILSPWKRLHSQGSAAMA